MSNYLLYGQKLIEKDDTMKDFAESIIKSIPKDDLNSSTEDLEEIYMGRVNDILIDDISRTNIDYEELMCRYAPEIGELLYNMENHGSDLDAVSIHFFGSEAEKSFNYLMTEYIYLKVFYITK
jgi:hypothetical protein